MKIIGIIFYLFILLINDCSGQTQTELTKDISPLSLTTYIGLNVTSYPVQLLNKVYKQQVFLAILYFG